MADQVVLRTRFFDDHLAAAVADGCHQVVLLAVGLDARAFRLRWPPGTRLFEVDLPEVVAFKESVLRELAAVALCERVVVAADLRGADWAGALAAAGHDPAGRTAWLIEGLLIYLSDRDVWSLLTTVGDLSAAGSRLAYTDGADLRRAVTAAPVVDSLRPVTDLWRGPRGSVDGWLRRHGWHVRAHDKSALAAAHGRPWPHPPGAFHTAERLP
jgi:methyltransferase (TIGR00027 family)